MAKYYGLFTGKKIHTDVVGNPVLYSNKKWALKDCNHELGDTVRRIELIIGYKVGK